MKCLAAVLLVAGCASAGSPEQVADANGQTSDGNETQLDASMPDAPPGPQTRTLSQTNNETIKGGNTIVCPGAAGGSTAATRYHRVFDLGAMGISSDFAVSKVSFKIQHCDKLNGSGTCTNVAVRVGTYAATPSSTLSTASMTILASNANVAVPEVIQDGTTTPGGTVDAPITATVPVGSKLIVEIDAPYSGTYALFMGTSDGGESAFGYIMSSDCDVTVPTNISGEFPPNVAAGPRNLLVTVTGTY